MKKLILVISILHFSAFVSAQDPINVTITGICHLTSGVFEYDGILNGKNHYTREYSDATGTFYFHVSLDGVKWVLYEGEAINEMAFYNLNVSTGMLPPNTEWIADICSEDTMIIEGRAVIATESLNLVNGLKAYQINDVLRVDIGTDLDIDSFEIQLYNILGQQTLSRKFRNNKNAIEIDTRNYAEGVYFIKVHDITKRILIR